MCLFLSMGARINVMNLNRKKAIKLFGQALQHSTDDMRDAANELIKNPSLNEALHLGKIGFNSSVWVSQTFAKLFYSPNIEIPSAPRSNSMETQLVIDALNSDKSIDPMKASHSDIFKIIFEEFEKEQFLDNYKTTLKVPPINGRILLISGIFNEVFSKAAFERAAQFLNKHYQIPYSVIKTHGAQSCDHNCEMIHRQIQELIQENPTEKLWIIAFSKGGLDALHYLSQYQEFADHIIGLSTIATPILGSNHTNSTWIQNLDRFSEYVKNSPFKHQRNVVKVLKKLKDSLCSNQLETWFQENYPNLPPNIFYSALALESSWYESHAWMVLTKLIFPTESINDGIVEADRALYPEYFNSINLGILKGHHLIGNRSSTFPQEALLLAHIYFLKYIGSLD